VIDICITDDGMTYKQAEEHFVKLDAWARENCASYVGHHVQDVTDFSLMHDLIAQFRFSEERDVAWFKLKWS